MNITAEKAKAIVRQVEMNRAYETAMKAENVFPIIEQEIIAAAKNAQCKTYIYLRSYILNAKFPDLDMAKNHIAAIVRQHKFTVTWDSNDDFILTVKW